MGKFRSMQEPQKHGHDLRQRTADPSLNRVLSLKAIEPVDPNKKIRVSEGIRPYDPNVDY